MSETSVRPLGNEGPEERDLFGVPQTAWRKVLNKALQGVWQ